VAAIVELRDGTQIPLEIPKFCPCCNTPLAQDEGKIALFCPNSLHCPAQTLGALEVFVSKHGANIESL
jgi:DNA ligase (NAD+)